MSLIPGIDKLFGTPGATAIPSGDRLMGQAVIPGVSSGIQLSTEQIPEYIRRVLDQTAMLKEARTYNVRGPQLDVSNINLPSQRTRVGLDPMDKAAASAADAPQFATVSYNPTPYELPQTLNNWQLGLYDIEGEGIYDTILQQMFVAYGNDLEENAIHASKTGSTPAGAATGYLTNNNGWIERALSGGNVLDYGGGWVRPKLFFDLFEKLPVKYRSPAYKNRLRFWVPQQVAEHWVYYIQSNKLPDTALMSITDGVTLRWNGIPIVPVPLMHVDDAGIQSQSGQTSGMSYALLSAKDNLVLAYEPQVRIHVGFDVEAGKFRFYYLFGQYDFGFDLLEAVALAYNVKPTMDPSLAL